MSQSQVNPAAGLTLEVGLKSLLRQDPEVIAIGEVRDRDTAEIALQAALTGHLTLTTFHAGSACEVIGRFLDMGIEPYAVRSGLRSVIAQRLLRRLCDACAEPTERPEDFLGLPLSRAKLPVGCDACRGTGYLGRVVVAEMLPPDSEAIGRAILHRADVRRLERIAAESGMVRPLATRVCRGRVGHDLSGRGPSRPRRRRAAGEDRGRGMTGLNGAHRSLPARSSG